VKAFVVGTAGHVDHGKTALVRALTGVDTDRWDEEKERGLTIDLGFAPLRVDEEMEIGVVDVPGHEDFVTNMLAGATGLDLLLLVVAADEGPMPQTREHLAIADLLGVEEGVVAVTKVDRVDEEWLELVEEAVRDELRTVLGHARWPLMPVSSTEGTGLDDLRREIEERADRLEGRPERDHFRMPVDRSFTVKGAGTVVTGTSWSGTVRSDDSVRVLPGARTSRVRSLQVHGEDRDRVPPGRRCAVALVGVDPEEVPRGSVLVTGEGWRAVESMGVRLRLPGWVGRTVEDGQRVRVYLGTREVMARAEVPGEVAVPGEEVWARLHLEAPLVARARDRFVLRFYSPVVTIGGGRVAALEPGPGWKGHADLWREVLEGEPAEALGAAVRLAGGGGLARGEAHLVTGLPVETVKELEERPPDGLLRVQGRWFASGLVEDIRERLSDELARLHREDRRSPGASLEALRSAVAEQGYAEPLVERILGAMVEEGEVEVDGPRVRLPGHRPRLTEEEQQLRDELRTEIEAGGLEPETVQHLERTLGGDGKLLHDLLDLLVREGQVVAVTPEIHLVPEAEERLRSGARRVLERGTPAGVSAFKDEFDVSRKYLIPYLEYLDDLGITRRTEDGRVPGPEA
jgi:selenocysteine-specific elongation factor